MSLLLSIQNIGKAYRAYRSESRRFASWFGLPVKPSEERWVLRHMSFEVYSGEAVGIVGQNGAGKSTLLKMIAGTLKPTEGKIQMNGRISAILELGMGFNSDLTGRQNAIHALSIMGFNTEEVMQIIPEIEKFSEINEYFDEPVRTYSSGMQMRVAFAVATAYRPEILIIDEALAVGDVFFQTKCFERINSFKKLGTTLILVTHSIGEIIKHCNRAIYIKDGRIKSDGSPRDISNIYTDDLFSKHKEKIIDSSNVEAPNETLDLMSGSADKFNTRQGYRKEEHYWGDGGARIIDFLIRANNQNYPPVIKSNSITDFCFKVIFDEEFEDVTAGILIKTHDGLNIYGSNSFYADEENQHISAKKGSIKIFKFKTSLELNAGHYLVSFGVSTGPQEMLKPLNRRYDSVLITLDREKPLLGIVDLRSEFEMIL